MIHHSAPNIGDAEVAAVERVLRSGCLAQGPEVAAFEAECAEALGRRHAVAVNSGTSALHLALGAIGVQPGGAVAAPSYACASLITAIHEQGATPTLCDIGPDYTLDPSTVLETCGAAIVVHLFGAPARLPAGIPVIEDIAQSMGGTTGRTGSVAITSFYATKLMTTGEGGMLLTDDGAIAEYARDRRDYDNRDDFVPRHNYKMTDIEAALGRVQLARLPEFLARRQAIALEYNAAFKDLPVTLPEPDGHVFFRYVIAAKERDALESHLACAGVEAKRPVHRPAHHYLGGEFPVSERAHTQCLSLPVHPSLSPADARHVTESVVRFFTAPSREGTC